MWCYRPGHLGCSQQLQTKKRRQRYRRSVLMLSMEVVITRSWLIIMAVHLLPRFRLTRLTFVRSFGKNTLTTASKKKLGILREAPGSPLLWWWSCGRNGSQALRFQVVGAGATCYAIYYGVAGEKPPLRRACVVGIESVCLPRQDYHQDMWYHPTVKINPSIAPPWTPHGFGSVQAWTHLRQLHLPHSQAPSLGWSTSGGAVGGSGGVDSDWAGRADHDRLNLHLSESWLDERTQTKLAEFLQQWKEELNYGRVRVHGLTLLFSLV